MSSATHEMRRPAPHDQPVFGSAISMPGTLELEVLSGAHAGARFPLKNDSLTLGSALDNDVVLFAADLPPHHLRLEVKNRLMAKITVHALDEPVLIDGDHWLEVGHSYNGKAPMRLKIGNADVAINAPKGWVGPLKLLGGLAALLLVIFVGIPMVQRMLLPTLTQIGKIAVSADAPLPVADEAAIAALRSRVNDAGLGGLIQIATGKGNSVVASGVVDEGRANVWRDIVKWYDMQPKAPLLINSVSRTQAIAGPQAIRSIWLDQNPQVMLMNGHTASKGDVIPGGWKVESIDSSGVVLTRDGLTQKIILQ